MATKLTDVGNEVKVEQLASFRGKRTMARGAVMVPKGDAAALEEEIVRQVRAIRTLKGIPVDPATPVV